MSVPPDLLEPFLIEARELADRSRADLARLQAAPADAAALDGLFRGLHTLKGSAGLVDQRALAGLLHAAEATLERARGGALAGGVAEGLLRALDAAEAWLDALEAGGEPPEALLRTVARLTQRLDGGEDRGAEAGVGDSGPEEEADAWARELVAGLEARAPLVAVRYLPEADAYFRGDDPLALARAIPGLLRLDVTAAAAEDRAAYDPYACTLRLLAVSEAPAAQVRAALRLAAGEARIVEIAPVAPAAAPDAGPDAPSGAALRLRALHVDAARLDAVAALADELVIARNALAHEGRRLLARLDGASAREFLARDAALDRIVADLHAAVTGLRLTPMGPLFARFPRQVRDLAETLGKSVEFSLAGEDATLDKSVVEGLFEPLLHLVRNAVDHGVETPAARRAAGKPQTARIVLRARAEGAEVVVEVSDDGRGIDPGAARAAAVARGLMSETAAAGLTEAAAAELIFAPGFSTAGRVSDLSGRGVGMDAVRAAVARLGGQVSLDNRPGEGLVVRLRLPARVRLAKILTVRLGDERFGVPLEMVAETHRVRAAEVSAVRQGEAFVRQDRVTPLVGLGELLRTPARPRGEVFPVLTVLAGGERVGVQVDAIGERMDAPVRPLAGLMAGYPGILGTVLQGDGQVLLVLDLAELAA